MNEETMQKVAAVDWMTVTASVVLTMLVFAVFQYVMERK